MGRKVHPVGFRLSVSKAWHGRWFAEGKQYREQLEQDFKIRKLMQVITSKAGVSRVDVERYPGKVKVTVHTAKPGILIGRKGEGIAKFACRGRSRRRIPCETILIKRTIY